MKASASMRTWFLLIGIILWTGIYLSGFSNVSWVLYVPAAGFIFGAATGLCLSLTAILKLFGVKSKGTSGK